MINTRLITYNMYTSSKITREEFSNSQFLKITIADFEKGYIRHSRFVFEVVTDRNKQTVKKKFSQIKRFSDEISQKFGMKEFGIQNHMRSSKREEEVQNLFKKLNSGYLMVKENASESQIQIKNQIRTYLYNLLFSNIEQIPSSDEDEPSFISKETSYMQTTPQKQRLEDPYLRQQKEKPKQRESSKIPNVIRNIFKPKRDGQESSKKRELLLRNIKTIWQRLERGWVQKLFTIVDDNLIMHQKGDPLYKEIIFLKFMSISLVEEDYMRIVLSHPLLKRNLQIRVNAPSDFAKDKREQYQNLLAALKDQSQRQDQVAYNFVGIRLSNKKNKFVVEPQKRPAHKLNLKFTHQHEIFSFMMAIDSSVYLRVPILNNYGKYEIEIIQEKQAGIIPNLRDNNTVFTLPVQNIYDQIYNEKPKRKLPEMKNHILQSKQCNYLIRLEYFDVTSWKSYHAGDVRDRFEGCDPPIQFTRDEFRIQKNRIKRILYSIEHLANYIKNLKNWQYPLQSSIFYVLCFLIILTFNFNHILQYILAIMCIAMAYLHPASHIYFRDLISLVSSSNSARVLQGKLQKSSWQPRYRIVLKKSQEKRKFLEEFNMRKKKKRNILEKYNRLQEILLKGQQNLAQFVTITQKIKNIFNWYHHEKTKWLFLLSLASFFLLLFIPLRVLFLGVMVKVCIKGKSHHKRTQLLNKLIVSQLFKITVQQQNLGGMREYLINPNKQFDKQKSQYHYFQKKSKQNLSQFLQIDFDPAIFTQSRCIGQLLQLISECRQRYMITEEICKKYKLNIQWSKSNSSLQRFLLSVYLFLINVPSDRNILDSKQEVEVEAREEDSDDEQMG